MAEFLFLIHPYCVRLSKNPFLWTIFNRMGLVARSSTCGASVPAEDGAAAASFDVLELVACVNLRRLPVVFAEFALKQRWQRLITGSGNNAIERMVLLQQSVVIPKESAVRPIRLEVGPDCLQ